MNRRALIVFVILNIVISIGVAMLVITLWTGSQPTTQSFVVQTIEVIITATPGPSQTPWVVTVQGAVGPVFTPQPGEPTVAPTLNPNVLPDIATSAAQTQTAIQVSGSTEQTYTVESGDSPSTIAQSFGVAVEDLLCANDLGTVDDPDYIFPGQVLLIPGPDFVCGGVAVGAQETDETALASGESGVPLATVEGALLGSTPVPTVTLAPTAENAQVVIMRVLNPGDVTSEGVEIRNLGGLVDLEGWTLYDTQGNIFTFPDYRLFPNAGVTVYTRVGSDTPVALFWDETRSVWSNGDVASLANAAGVVQSTFRIGVDGAATVPPATQPPS